MCVIIVPDNDVARFRKSFPDDEVISATEYDRRTYPTEVWIDEFAETLIPIFPGDEPCQDFSIVDDRQGQEWKKRIGGKGRKLRRH